MKKFYAPAIIVLLLLLLPSVGGGTGVMPFVDLPNGVEVGIASLILFLASWLFVQLITLFPFLAFLDEFKVPLATAVSAQLIAWIEQLVPDAYGDVAISGIVFILAILAVFGVGAKLAKMNARGFQSRA